MENKRKFFTSRADYLAIVDELYKQIFFNKPSKWFAIKIQVGFFLHLIYGGKIILDDEFLKEERKISLEKKTGLTFKRLLKKIYYFPIIKFLEMKLCNNLKGKRLLIGYYAHNIKNKTYNIYLHPFYKADEMEIFYLDKGKNNRLLQKYFDSLLGFYSEDTNIYRSQNLELTQQVSQFLDTGFNIHSRSFQKGLYNNLNGLDLNRKATSKFLSVLNPEELFCYCYYDSFTNLMLHSANDLNIKTIEYQHSSITDTHFAYSPWENVDELFLHFPDTFYVWEEEDKNLIIKNFSGKIYKPKVEVVGNKYLKNSMDTVSSSSLKDTKNILICLQGQWIPEFLEKFILSDHDYNWYFRLHPRYPQDKEQLEALKNNKPDNIIVDRANQTELYELFQEVTTVITSFSGTALEAEKFDKKIIIFGEEGYYSYKEKINSGKYAFIDDYNKISNYIK